MRIIHDPNSQQINFLDERFYTRDGIKFWPSVTTILEAYPKGRGFTEWLKAMGVNAEETVRRAGEQGTHVHEAIDHYLYGKPLSWVNEEGKPNYTFQEWIMILRFVDFWTTYKPEIIAHEISLVSDTLRIGGTIDLICRINGQIFLIDHKTSNALHTSYELQKAAYAMLWNETQSEDLHIQRAGILHLKAATRGPDKTGKILQGEGWILKEHTRPYKEAYQLFKHTQAIWEEENPNYKPKNLIYPDTVSIASTESASVTK